jgi:hypothetical protein
MAHQAGSLTSDLLCWPQVCLLPVGLGRERARKIFTYYPSMPGNATTRPAEKAALQQGSMRASFFEGAQELACEVLSLEDVIAEQGIERIDLLKVSLCRSWEHSGCK